MALLALAPRSSIEIGCGIGLYTSWLAQMGGTAAIGIEPIVGSPAVFGSSSSWPEQLVADFSNATEEAQACDAALPKFDVVMSFEVMEHIPLAQHGTLFDFMLRRAGGFVVLSVARPGQPGTGHIAGRVKGDVRKELERRGMVYLPKTTRWMSSMAREVMKSNNVLPERRWAWRRTRPTRPTPPSPLRGHARCRPRCCRCWAHARRPALRIVVILGLQGRRLRRPLPSLWRGPVGPQE
eukprot:21862-Prymnesium_polylepis.1